MSKTALFPGNENFELNGARRFSRYLRLHTLGELTTEGIFSEDYGCVTVKLRRGESKETLGKYNFDIENKVFSYKGRLPRYIRKDAKKDDRKRRHSGTETVYLDFRDGARTDGHEDIPFP